MLRVDSERCKGCGVCLDVCPTGAIHLVNRVATIDANLCRECEACVQACPQGAIQRVTEQAPVVVEGEAVVLTERQEVTRQVVAAPARPVPKPWLSGLGTVLAFLGREIVPRVTASLLDAWDRRRAAAALHIRSAEGRSLLGGGGQGGGRRRQRQRQRRGR